MSIRTPLTSGGLQPRGKGPDLLPLSAIRMIRNLFRARLAESRTAAPSNRATRPRILTRWSRAILTCSHRHYQPGARRICTTFIPLAIGPSRRSTGYSRAISEFRDSPGGRQRRPPGFSAFEGLATLGSNSFLPSDEISQTLQITDDFTKVYGKHGFKMGIEYQHVKFSTLQPAWSHGNGTTTALSRMLPTRTAVQTASLIS